MNAALIKEEINHIIGKISNSSLLYPRLTTFNISYIWGNSEKLQTHTGAVQRHVQHTMKGKSEGPQPSLGSGPCPACPLATPDLKPPFLSSSSRWLIPVFIHQHPSCPMLITAFEEVISIHSLNSFLSSALHTTQA